MINILEIVHHDLRVHPEYAIKFIPDFNSFETIKARDEIIFGRSMILRDINYNEKMIIYSIQYLKIDEKEKLI